MDSEKETVFSMVFRGAEDTRPIMWFVRVLRRLKPDKVYELKIAEVSKEDGELLVKHEYWIHDGEDRRCSGCKAIIEKDEWLNHNWNFCYHCGARMDGDKND